MSLQKEENGKVKSTLPSSQNQFVQSGLGPGQEYEVSISAIKNNTRGPQTSKKITTSEFHETKHVFVKLVAHGQRHGAVGFIEEKKGNSKTPTVPHQAECTALTPPISDVLWGSVLSSVNTGKYANNLILVLNVSGWEMEPDHQSRLM